VEGCGRKVFMVSEMQCGGGTTAKWLLGYEVECMRGGEDGRRAET
jgi:hypothetical protein